MGEYSDDLVVTAANLYYLENLTQEEVACKLGLSRVAVSRVLKRARDLGFVQVSIRRPLPELFDLGLRLEKAWDLKVVRVVATGAGDESTLDNLGRAGAELVAYYGGPGKRIGAAWSRTVSSIVPHLKRPARPPLCVTELAGAYLEPGTPFGVSWRLADKLGARLETIPAPILAATAEAKAFMMRERSVIQAFENGARVDLALVGLGGVDEEASIVRTGYVNDENLAEINDRGAVGDILMRYFDAQGRHIPMSFEDRAVSLEWEAITRLPLVIAMAFGPRKIAAMRGAMAGGVIQGLVTDRESSLALLAGTAYKCV
jgi:DNA-binding transcriptional regulator LsrR (DeoR family)